MKISKTEQILDETHGRYWLKIRRRSGYYLWAVFDRDGDLGGGRCRTAEKALNDARQLISVMQDDDAVSEFLLYCAKREDPNFGVHPDHWVEGRRHP